MKRLLFFILFLMAGLAGAAGQTAEVYAPAMVQAGRPFNVEFRISAQGRIAQPRPRWEGLTELANGMTVSESVVNDNGKVTSSSVYIFTFTLVGRQAGVFTIPAVSGTTADGKTYRSKPTPVEVVDEGGAGVQPGGPQGASGGQTAPEDQAPSTGRQVDDLFIRAVVDRTTVWKGEPVRVYFKLYTRLNVSGDEGGKMPSFNGFWAEQLDTKQTERQQENYNSAVYNTFIVREYLLFPQQSGTLTIDPMQLNLVVMEIGRQPQSMEEFLFGGGPEVVEKRRTVSSAPVKITVRELPAGAPASFNGAVGDFTMTGEAPSGEIATNVGATYRIRVAGTGNLRQITAPAVELPASFEVLNSKNFDDVSPSSGGLTGSRQFEYPFIVRGEGNFVIAPVQFSFFDPKKGEYKTVATNEVRLQVLADSLSTGGTQGGGIVGGVTRKDLEILNKDIRFIKHDAPELRPRGAVFMGSVAWFMALGVVLAAFVLLYFYLRKLIRVRRDADIMRGRRANKVVLSRLRTAQQYMDEGNARRFHDEMLKALWGYMGDKLNIPAANLTKENVREQLIRREVPADLITKYTDLISACESAQYSPAESAPMSEVYGAAADAISKVERYFK